MNKEEYNKLLDQEVTTSSMPQDELNALNFMSSECFEAIRKGYTSSFNDWSINFILNIHSLDKKLLTPAQKNKLNEIYDKFVEGN